MRLVIVGFSSVIVALLLAAVIADGGSLYYLRDKAGGEQAVWQGVGDAHHVVAPKINVGPVGDSRGHGWEKRHHAFYHEPTYHPDLKDNFYFVHSQSEDLEELWQLQLWRVSLTQTLPYGVPVYNASTLSFSKCSERVSMGQAVAAFSFLTLVAMGVTVLACLVGSGPGSSPVWDTVALLSQVLGAVFLLISFSVIAALYDKKYCQVKVKTFFHLSYAIAYYVLSFLLCVVHVVVLLMGGSDGSADANADADAKDPNPEESKEMDAAPVNPAVDPPVVDPVTDPVVVDAVA